MTTHPFAPTIRTQTDLESAWRHLMGPWGFAGSSVWMMLVVDDLPLPQLTEITESEEPPDGEMVEAFADLVRTLADGMPPGARFAFLRSRPGHGRLTDDDRAWAAALYDAALRAGVPCEVVHLATRGAVRPIARDDLDAVPA